jgi:hypothetical protein
MEIKSVVNKIVMVITMMILEIITEVQVIMMITNDVEVFYLVNTCSFANFLATFFCTLASST